MDGFDPQFQSDPPEVLIMDCRPDADDKLALAATLAGSYPTTGILLVSDTPAELALPALRIGVQDILTPEATMEEFGAAVESIAAVTQHRARQFSEVPAQTASANRTPKGRIIAVVSPKGGVGKPPSRPTWRSGWLPARPSSTVLVDLDIQFGDVGSALLNPEHSFTDDVRTALPARRDGAEDLPDPAPDRSVCDLRAQHAQPRPTRSAPKTSRTCCRCWPRVPNVVVDTAPGMTDTTWPRWIRPPTWCC